MMSHPGLGHWAEESSITTVNITHRGPIYTLSGSKKRALLLMAVPLSDVKRFSKLFHLWKEI